jgi:uncharacterized damage-inducible protein DinB
MFHSLNDFFATWQYEREATLKIFRSLTDDALQQQVTPTGRSLGRLANHIIGTLTEMPHRLGLPIDEQDPEYKTVADLVSGYVQAADNLEAALKETWTDASLEAETNMYGENWKNGYSLMVLITHQIHHRGQMTVLMRQAGLVVPGVYGPASEEWAAMGFPAMA